MSKQLMHLIILIKNALKHAQQERCTSMFLSVSDTVIVGKWLSDITELKTPLRPSCIEVSCLE